MKLPILFICALFLFRTSFAQKISFTDTSNKWNYNNSWKSGPVYGMKDYHDFYKYDTVLNGVVYKDFGFGLVREDTANEIVYIRHLSVMGYATIYDTGEYVLYNYNLQVGDSIEYNYTQPKRLA